MSSEIRNFGICGATSQGILQDALPRAEAFRPTLAVLLAGTNDMANKDSLRSPGDFRASYHALLHGLAAMGARVIALTIPPLIDRAFEAVNGRGPYLGFLPNERLVLANQIVREEAAAAGAILVDINAIFGATDLESVHGYIRQRRNAGGKDDGCHPTPEGYRAIAFALHGRIRELGLDASRIACIGDSITYGAYMKGEGTASGETYPGVLHALLNPNDAKAKPVSDTVAKGVVYQISLRSFTPEGTLAAAAERLADVAATGADLVYLCPFVEADPDVREEFWSPRQKASGCHNPRNPYRISDFGRIDPEYGTDEDLRRFVDRAHGLGLKVLFDLVFYHAGPTFALLHPDFVVRAGDGSPASGQWAFPRLEFGSHALREHLWRNMEHWVRDFDADGFRCDVGGAVPLDFWEEGRRRAERIKPGLVFLDEDELSRPDDQLRTFDINYAFSFGLLPHVLDGDLGADDLAMLLRLNAARAPRGARFLRAVENHDIANDAYDRRVERLFGPLAMEAMLALCFTLDGVPFLYNGEEDCDTARHSIFARPGEFPIRRGPGAESRRSLLRRLADLRRRSRALQRGETTFVPSNYPREVLAFTRETAGERVFAAINLSARNLLVKPASGLPAGGGPLLAQGAARKGDEIELASYGFLVLGE